jgi:hypothetical protein
MNSTSTLKVFGAAVALSLAGCLNASQDDIAKEEQVNLVNTTTHSLAKAAEFSESELGAQCPKLAKLLDDLTEAMMDQSGEWPQSFRDFLDCFDLPAEPTEEDFEDFGKKMEEDPTEFLDCVCGGSALSDALKSRSFSADLSVAASTYFDASQSSAGSTSFNAANSSAASSQFDASKSP